MVDALLLLRIIFSSRMNSYPDQVHLIPEYSPVIVVGNSDRRDDPIGILPRET